jgi:hypothetical protein
MKRDREDVSDAVGQAAPQIEWALAVAQRFNDAVSQAVSQQLAVHPEKITELAASNGRLHGEWSGSLFTRSSRDHGDSGSRGFT